LDRKRKKKQEEGENCIKRPSSIFLIKCYSGDQIKENAMGGYVTLIGGKKKCMHSFCGEAWSRENI
jgi:hypothetical protein